MFEPKFVKKDASKGEGGTAEAGNDVVTLSAAAVDCAKRGVFCGIVRSLGYYLFNNTPDTKVASNKMRTFINAALASKDITEDEARYQFDCYFNGLKSQMYAADVDCCAPCCSSSYLSWYMIISNIVNDVNCFQYAFNDETKKQLTEDEQKVIDGLHKARQAFFEAQTKFENYFREVNKTVLRNILLKYGTTFNQIAPDWYKDACQASGMKQEEK